MVSTNQPRPILCSGPTKIQQKTCQLNRPTNDPPKPPSTDHQRDPFSRWAPTSYKCGFSYNPYKWPYKRVAKVITLLLGAISLHL